MTGVSLHGYSATAGGAPRHAAVILCVKHIAISAVFITAAHGKLIAVSAADNNSILRKQFVNYGGIKKGGKTTQYLRACRNFMALVADVIFYGYCNAEQLAQRTTVLDFFINFLCLQQGIISKYFEVSVQVLGFFNTL